MQQNEQHHIYRALSIAGSDSGGGAGIQADLKTFASFSVYGMSVVTSLTAQNTLGVQGVHSVPPTFVGQQLRSIFDDLVPDAIKTGMLGTSETIRAVVPFLRATPQIKVVVDPVMFAKGGASLLQQGAVATLCSELLPLAYMVTPNIPEAEWLCGYPIQSWADCRRAAADIAKFGPHYVIIKGGHAQAEWGQPNELESSTPWRQTATDLVYANGRETYFSTPRIPSHKTHGTGCTFASALTACLAQQASAIDAIASAKRYVFQAIASAAEWDVGNGHGPLDHSIAGQLVTGTALGNHYGLVDNEWIDKGVALR